VSREEQLAWEGQAGRPVAAAAFLAALLVVIGLFWRSSLIGDAGTSPEEVKTIAADASSFVLSTSTSALGVLLFTAVFYYLYRAAKFRRPQLPGLALVFGLAGPVLWAIVSVLREVEVTDVAKEGAAGGPLSAEAADDLFSEGDLATYQAVFLGASLVVALAFVTAGVNAMRTGLLSRLMGIVGMVLGALFLFGGASVPHGLYIVALGVLFLGRWPGGRGPAWETGEAIPWPSAAQQARERAEAQQAAEEDRSLLEPAEDGRAESEEQPQPRSRKRKRKRR
jgi:hypothetical protein